MASSTSGNEPIKFSDVVPDQIPDGTALKLKFRCADVDHPLYGQSTELIGEIPLMLPKG